MEYRVLGSLEAWSGSERLALGPPKQRAVLAVLLLHAGELVPTDRLIESAWGERAPRTAAHSIQIYVSELRKVLEHDGAPAAIVTRPPGYSLVVDPDQIDARRFERLVAEGTRRLEEGDAAAAAASIREALGLWRGPPLSDFAYEEFAQDEARRLEALHADALERLAAAELALGREQAALAAADTAIAEDPLRERSRELRMLALCRSGRHPEALRTYQEFASLLREELGIEPGPSLRRLQEQVLLHDPTLGPTAASRPGPATAPARNPYKGLRPFGEADADDFFGREALVAELVRGLDRGTRLLALVGPSGSGKSSVIHAGLLPALRGGALPGSDGWVIARMLPGPRPLRSLDAAIRLACAQASGDEAGLRGEGGLAAARSLPPDGRLLLVIDQLEELFTIGDEQTSLQFLRDLVDAVTDPLANVIVVMALRADYYHRPLLYPDFASLFTAGVVNVVPMGADSLQAAMVGPARRVGVDVEAALLAQLTADTVDRPSVLPLLQYTLTELFERRTGSVLTLEGYRRIGGLRKALSRRAEEAYASLPEDRRAVALQLFLRLTAPPDGRPPSRRRVPLRELASLELDPVALSDVLDLFGRHRLLSFDRDPVSGDASVEMAHEALLSEWERLAGWADEHRADLRQHDAFVTAADEWESSGREPDYLLIGSRLDGYEAWSRATALGITVREREYLDAAIARRRSEQAEEAARRDRQRRLERRATVRLWSLLGAVALLAAAAMFGVLSWLGDRPPAVALLVEGTGDAGFGDMAVDGLTKAAADFGLSRDVATAKLGSREVETKLRGLSDEGVRLVVVGIGVVAQEATATVAGEHPDTRYVVWENERAMPNATNITFRSREAAYLAGVAAAAKSRTRILGFIGGCRDPLVDEYLAGYEAGARSAVPDIEVRAAYLTPPDVLSGFGDPGLGAEAAERLYVEGADVILVVAGSSALGVFRVATSDSEEQGKALWAIGADTDQYQSVLVIPPGLPAGEDRTAWQPHILTSVLKRLDRAFYTVIGDYSRGSLAPGQRSFGLAEGGVDISYSGGFIDDLRARLDRIRADIVSGEIKVPTEPTSRVLVEAPPP